MDAIFSRVFIPTTVMLFIAVSVSASDISVSFFSSYWNILLLLTVLSTSLIKYITGFRLAKLPYISIP